MFGVENLFFGIDQIDDEPRDELWIEIRRLLRHLFAAESDLQRLFLAGGTSSILTPPVVVLVDLWIPVPYRISRSEERGTVTMRGSGTATNFVEPRISAKRTDTCFRSPSRLCTDARFLSARCLGTYCPTAGAPVGGGAGI